MKNFWQIKSKYNLILRRYFAYMVDSLFIFILFVISQSILQFFALQPDFSEPVISYIYTLGTITLPFVIIISLIEIITSGHTIGKKLMSLKIKPDINKNFLLRNMIKFSIWESFHLALWFEEVRIPLIIIGYSLIIINILIFIFKDEKSSIHDLIMGTRVDYFGD